MTARAVNMSASVHQRLLNLARVQNKRFDDLLQHYALERWLYRLSTSDLADRFVLKGGLMLLVWQIPVFRPTRDIDLLAKVSNDPSVIAEMVSRICGAPVEDDGLEFDSGSIVTTRIAEDAEYEGVRATLRGSLGNARVTIRIDLGFSDVVTPAPVAIDYPPILDYPAPVLLAYNRETAIAEKFEAMVKLGDLNSRMKDFFDIWALADSGEFNGANLRESIAATFERRVSELDMSARCFQFDFGASQAKEVQWRAFIKRSVIQGAPDLFVDAWKLVIEFLRPIAESIERGGPFLAIWHSGGPWQKLD